MQVTRLSADERRGRARAPLVLAGRRDAARLEG